MPSNLFNRYIWLVDTIYRTGRITLEDINLKWIQSSISDGNPIPKRTFHNQRIAIEEMFDISIKCNPGTYEYFIENAEELESGSMRRWLLNSFAVNNMINESHKLKQRIIFEEIPSGQQYLTTIIEAMRDGMRLKMKYQSHWMDSAVEFEVQPYFIKVFKQRWYVIGKSDKLRIYALDRVESLVLGSRAFKMPTDFDPQKYFEDCYGIIHDVDITPQLIRIKVFSRQAKYVRALPLHHSQKETETKASYSIFEYFIKPTFDFRQELLSMGEDIEVLSPESFRTEIKKVYNNVMKLYQ